MKLFPLEKILLTWADKKSYRATDREWYNDLSKLQQTEYELDPTYHPEKEEEEEEDSQTNLEIRKSLGIPYQTPESHQDHTEEFGVEIPDDHTTKTEYLQHQEDEQDDDEGEEEIGKDDGFLWIPTFRHFICTPTGYAIHKLEYDQDESQTEEHVLEQISKGAPYSEDLRLYHGPNLADWRSNKIIEDERIRNSDILLHYTITQPKDYIKHASIQLIYHGHKTDKTEYPLTRKYHDRLSRVGSTLLTLGIKHIHTPDHKKPANSKVKIYNPEQNQKINTPRLTALIRRIDHLIENNQLEE